MPTDLAYLGDYYFINHPDDPEDEDAVSVSIVTIENGGLEKSMIVSQLRRDYGFSDLKIDELIKAASKP